MRMMIVITFGMFFVRCVIVVSGVRATTTAMRMRMMFMKEHETHNIHKQTAHRNGKKKMFMMMMIFRIETSMHGFTKYCNCNHNEKNGVGISL